ncbi:MAG: hypothetical protein RLZ04_2416 [Actinomycetota bacterium]
MPPKSDDPLRFVTTSTVAVVAGKGGVGKTTVTAVLARAAVRRGLRVVVVELDGKTTLDALLPGIEILHLSGTQALAEYLGSHGWGRVSSRLARSGVIDVIASASPGLDDLVLLGRVKQLEGSGNYDLVVVDGPAAGHSLSMLRSADGLGAIARSGPIKNQADEVTAMLTDPARCQVVLVTLPETTPVNEAVETAYSLEEDIGVHLGPLIVNAVDDGPDLDLDGPGLADTAPEGSALRRAAEFRNARRRLQRTERERLGAELALPQIVLPAVAGALDAAAIEALAATLDPADGPSTGGAA